MKAYHHFKNKILSVVIFYLAFFACSALNAQVQIETFYKADNKVVFCKIDNAIMISGPNLDLNTVKIKVDNGTYSGDSGKYYVKPNKYKPYLTVEVFGNGISLGKGKLKILKIPDPEVCYANICGTDIKVALNQTMNPLLPKITGFTFDKYAKILSFELAVGGKKMTAEGNNLTEEMKKAVKAAGKGAQIIFSKIKCMMPFDEERVLKSVKVTII